MDTAIRLAIALALVGACDKKSADKTPPTTDQPPPPSNKGEPPPETPPTKPPPTTPKGKAALTLEGKVTGSLDATNSTVTCEGKDNMGSFRARPTDGSYELTIMITSEEEWKKPAIALNVTKPERASFVRKPADERPEDKFELAKDFSKAEIDVVLRAVVGKETIAIKGTIDCK
jgi:hypothetical protein